MGSYFRVCGYERPIVGVRADESLYRSCRGNGWIFEVQSRIVPRVYD